VLAYQALRLVPICACTHRACWVSSAKPLALANQSAFAIGVCTTLLFSPAIQKTERNGFPPHALKAGVSSRLKDMKIPPTRKAISEDIARLWHKGYNRVPGQAVAIAFSEAGLSEKGGTGHGRGGYHGGHRSTQHGHRGGKK
jgi:hypothetical protein